MTAKKPPAKSDDTQGLEGQDPEVVHTDNGTQQKEPTAEELPADAKVTPPLEQVNPSAARAVGTAGDVSYGDADDAVQEGIDAHKDSVEDATPAPKK